MNTLSLRLTSLAATALSAIFPLFPQVSETSCGDWTLQYLQSPGGSSSDIILVKAIGSGDLDLTQVKDLSITGALPAAFAYNAALTSVRLPASLKDLSYDLEITKDITGEGEPYTSSSTAGSDKSIGAIPLNFNLNAKPVRIVLNVTTNGASANRYGCCLLASGTDPFASGSYADGFQIFLENNSGADPTITVKDGSSTTGTKFTHATGDSFTVQFYYNPEYDFMMVAVKYADGTVDTTTVRTSTFSADTLCYGLPVGVDETMTISDACMPFAGCSALQSITVADGSSTYANGSDGVLLNAAGSAIAAYPYGRLFGKVVRVETVGDNPVCLSVDAYASGSGYEGRSALFQSADTYFGTTLFRLEANANGTCSLRHLNTGFLLGRKSDNGSTTLDAVQNSVYSGQFDYTLVPDSPLEAEFVFTDPYVGPVQSFDGVWCISDVSGQAVMSKNVSIADHRNSFHINQLDTISVPLNSYSLASICLPVDIVVPESPVETMAITMYNPDLPALIGTPLSPGSIVKAGEGVVFWQTLTGASLELPISSGTGESAATSGNMLTGTNLRIPAATGKTYLLSDCGYKAQTDGNIPANTAYLLEATLPPSASGRDYLNLVDKIYTGVSERGIDAPEAGSASEGIAFDLSGRRVNPSSATGIIILNGKKTISHP